MRIAGATLGVAWLIVLGAYAYAATLVNPSVGSVVAAVAALLIAGTAILYAWREPGR
jgi:hypothetical protein